MKGCSNDGIKDWRNKERAKWQNGNGLRRKFCLGTDCRSKSMGKCNPAVFCKQRHGSDFQIFAPSDSPCKLRKWSNRQLCLPGYVDDIPRSVIHFFSRLKSPGAVNCGDYLQQIWFMINWSKLCWNATTFLDYFLWLFRTTVGFQMGAHTSLPLREKLLFKAILYLQRRESATLRVLNS